ALARVRPAEVVLRRQRPDRAAQPLVPGRGAAGDGPAHRRLRQTRRQELPAGAARRRLDSRALPGMTRQYASVRGALDLESPPMRLYQKAKRLGVWDPRDLDFAADIAAWPDLTADERDLLLRVTALFQAGEEAVTADLLPLVDAIAAE